MRCFLERKKMAISVEEKKQPKHSSHYMEYFGCSLMFWTVPGAVLFIFESTRPTLLWIFFIHIGIVSIMGITSIIENILEKKFNRKIALAKKTFFLSLLILIFSIKFIL